MPDIGTHPIIFHSPAFKLSIKKTQNMNKPTYNNDSTDTDTALHLTSVKNASTITIDKTTSQMATMTTDYSYSIA